LSGCANKEQDLSIFRRVFQVALLVFGLMPIILIILSFIVVGAGNITTNPIFYILFDISIISIFATFITYIIHVYKNRWIKRGEKHLWAAILFLGNMFVYPVYWYLYVWKQQKQVNNCSSSQDHDRGGETRKCNHAN